MQTYREALDMRALSGTPDHRYGLTLPMAVVVLVVEADRRVSRAVFKERATAEYPGPVPRFRA